MASQMTRSLLSFVFDEVVSAVMYNEFAQEPMLFPALYGMQAAPASRRVRTASLSGLGKFQAKTEGANATQDNLIQQFEKTFTHTTFGLYTEITVEAINDNEFSLFQSLGQELGMAAARTMEDDAGDVLDDAFAGATYLAEDGLSICNTAHLNVDGGNSQSNSGTAALSHTNLATARQNMKAFTDYRGERISIRPDALIVPNALEDESWEIVRSTGRSDTTNRADNFFFGKFDLFVWDALDDANNWFVIDQNLAKRHLVWYQRQALETWGDNDYKKGARTVGATYRESHGVKDWRWIYGNNVT